MLIIYNLMHFSTIDDCIRKEYLSPTDGFQMAKLFPSSSKSVLVMEPQIVDLFQHNFDFKMDLVGATCAINQLVVYPSAEKSDEIHYEYTKVVGCGILEEEIYDEPKQEFHVSSAHNFSMQFFKTFAIFICEFWLIIWL